MNIRQAFLRAADHIERNPQDYDFCNNGKPACGTPGCLLGWVGAFAHVEVKTNPELYTLDVAESIGHTWQDVAGFAARHDIEGYTHKSKVAAQLLRMFADAHFPEKLGIPASVRAIFDAPALVPEFSNVSTPKEQP